MHFSLLRYDHGLYSPLLPQCSSPILQSHSISFLSSELQQYAYRLVEMQSQKGAAGGERRFGYTPAFDQAYVPYRQRKKVFLPKIAVIAQLKEN